MTGSETLPITYRFRRADGVIHEMAVEIDAQTLRSKPLSSAPYPDWVKVSFHQCDGCQWKENDQCPVAIRLADPIQQSLNIVSFEAVEVEVESPDRTYRKKVDMQQGLSSLFGLLMATSGCPSLAPFRPLARYHLPFASFDETFFRIFGASLIRNFFEGSTAVTRDEIIERVNKVYADAAIVNAGVMNRLRAGIAAMADSSPNAVALLAAFSGLVPLTAEKQIRKVEALFKA